MLINATKIKGQYLNKALFENVSFVINEQDKIGVIGANGAGKSTLLKMIVGEISPYSGNIARKKDLKIGYLPQESNFNQTDTILETVLKSDKEINDFEAKSTLSKMGLNEPNKLIKNLSGGELKRVGLAIALLKPSDLLILDEPTNHLDLWMISYLEKFLIKYNRAILMVTHDRYFLERVTKKIMEIDKSGVTIYDATYSLYLSQKAEHFQSLIASERKLSVLYKKEAEWASLNPQARSTKSKERLEHFKKLEDDLKKSRDIISNDQNYNLDSIDRRIGKKTIILENVSQEVAGNKLFTDFSYNVKRFDRLGIVGKNGCGKTTLFKTIMGIIPPTNGEVIIGETVKIGYFKQVGLTGESSMKIIDYVKSFGEYVDTTNGRISASALLEQYLFTPHMQQMSINTLSGGEKRRLQLITVLITNPNILLLDEPTNDLDIYTLEILEDYLETFKGAVIVVSHDRYFLDKVADHLLVFKDGGITEYNGIISDYLLDDKNSEVKKEEKVKQVVNQEIPRFSSKEKKEFDNILGEIDCIEGQIKEKQMLLEKETTDYEKIMQINNDIDSLKEALNIKVERWVYLSEIDEKIKQYRENKYKGN